MTICCYRHLFMNKCTDFSRCDVRRILIRPRPICAISFRRFQLAFPRVRQATREITSICWLFGWNTGPIKNCWESFAPGKSWNFGRRIITPGSIKNYWIDRLGPKSPQSSKPMGWFQPLDGGGCRLEEGLKRNLEPETRLELATSTLARLRSTN